MHAAAFLKAAEKQPLGPIVVLYGAERFLKNEALKVVTRLVLGEGEEELALTRLAGNTVELKSVVDSLLTVSMWSAKQLVVVDDADDFVTRYREGLERYLERPAKKSVLVLEVKSWPANTRLAKKTAAIGLPLECGSLKGTELFAWLGELSRGRHGKKLDRGAAQVLVDLAGNDLGLLDQELGKLAAYVGSAPAIDAEAVEKLVGGWKTETTWRMLDAVRDGQLGSALEYLEKLLVSGEHPLKLLGGVNFVFRPLARATELARQGLPLAEALTQAGVKPFTIGPVQAYLRRLGRPRAEKIGHWLLQADLDLKGSSRLPDRAIIERLLVELGGKT
ncbi:MAG: DNA polymerase III subunit delta [Planctomycetaceae bacterium]|nr:DNA polymerase III subunit delta [Planctomycetaceae bacterium]